MSHMCMKSMRLCVYSMYIVVCAVCVMCIYVVYGYVCAQLRRVCVCDIGACV